MRGEVASPVQFLADARLLAERNISNEARAMLLSKAATGKIDLAWLRTTALTDVELDQLGLRRSLPWNDFKQAADDARTGATGKEVDNVAITASLQIRGVAGEIVARDVELPHGFKIKGHGVTAADGLEPDYDLVGPDGSLADLEVKANRPDEWPSLIRDAQEGHPSDTMQRFIKQLKGSKARGRKVYVAVTDGMSGVSKRKLRELLQTEGAAPDEIVEMSEEQILATGRALREHLGIPQPSFAAKGTK